MGMLSIDENIETSDDIEFLRRIRDIADTRLHVLQDAKDKANLTDLSSKYVGKYILIYGKRVTMASSFINRNDINIFRVKELAFIGGGMFRIIGLKLRICTADQYDDIEHLTDTAFASLIVSVSDGATMSIYEKDIEAILEPAQVYEYIQHAVGLQDALLKNWKEACDDAV